MVSVGLLNSPDVVSSCVCSATHQFFEGSNDLVLNIKDTFLFMLFVLFCLTY